MLSLLRHIKSLPICRVIFLIGVFLLGANWHNVYLPSFPWFTRYIQYVNAQKYQRATFAEKIAAIDFKVGKWQNPVELLNSKDFQAIYSHPICYYKAAKVFLAQPFRTHNQKRIVAYALCYLPAPCYKDWLNTCLALHQKGKIDDLLLSIIQSYAVLQSVDGRANQSTLCALPKPQEVSLEQVIEDRLVAVTALDKQDKDKWYLCSSGLMPLTELVELTDADYWAIYTHPDHYIEAIVKYLVDYNKRNRELSSDVKRFKVLNVMRLKKHLSPSGYAQLVAICWHNYKEGVISPMQLYSMVACEDYEGIWVAHKMQIMHPYVVKCYKDLDLQCVLGEIQRNPGLPAAIRIKLIDLTTGLSKWHNRANSEIIAMAGDRSFFFHEDLHGIYMPVTR